MRPVIFLLSIFVYFRSTISADYGPSWYKCNENCASLNPPGGLAPNRTPQFILLTHDDTVHPKSTANIDFLVGGLEQSNGCRIPCTFFVMTNGTDPKEVRKRWEMGDEIGAHCMDHLNQLDPGVGEKGKYSEIVGSRDWIVEKAGLPAGQVLGYRTPLLAESVEQRQILEDAGFLYDSSIVETVKVEEKKGYRVWPYSMEYGIPQNRHRIKKGTEKEERHKGLWQVPVWVLVHNGQRYCMDPGRGGEGNDAEGDPYEVLKSNLDASYNGNRAPIPFYIHVFWFNGEREKRAREFVEYALTKPGVYFVTMQTLIAWMKDPIPVDKMDKWLAGRCQNAAAAGRVHALVKEKRSSSRSSVMGSTTDLPGFTRSVYRRNYALITPESQVWAGNPLWNGAMTAHLISPTVGANFAMYLANMKENGTASAPAPGIERFVFILDGLLTATIKKKGLPTELELHADQFVYFPPDTPHTLSSTSGAGLLIYERRYAVPRGTPTFQYGHVASQPVLPVDGEVFLLRKLLPQTSDFDFNIHVMDFLPGEHLNVKEVHYNQHGLLLLAGKGIYRLGDEWMPVTKGDAIWMAPYCPQWYAALGPEPSRYIIYKDTTIDPLEG